MRRPRSGGRRQEEAQGVEIALLAAEQGTERDEAGAVPLTLRTSEGDITCRYHNAPGAKRAVIWVGGAGGGLDGPARGLYPAMAQSLAESAGITSLRLHYRHPNHLEECVLDTLLGAAWLQTAEGIEHSALVGHSFGGAVVITAGALGEAITAVAALSSQTYGTDLITRLAPKPLLLLHGMDDEVLPFSCSTSLHARAGEPKTIKLYPGARHGLDECREELIADLRAWLITNLPVD